MSSRNQVVWSIATACLFLAIFTWPSLAPKEVAVLSAMTEETEQNPSVANTLIHVHGATEEQLVRLELAVQRFEELGLHLPPLDVHFLTSVDSCDGRKGHFSAGTSPWSIEICSTEVHSVYVHELAHAWEQANLTDAQRDAFMESRGLSEWSDRDLPWNERGKEWVAVIVQQGLSGLPLPPALSVDARSRLAAFETLTGQIAPTLETWLQAREVPCDQRPTTMSAQSPDATGLTCPYAEPRALGVAERRLEPWVRRSGIRR